MVWLICGQLTCSPLTLTNPCHCGCGASLRLTNMSISAAATDSTIARRRSARGPRPPPCLAGRPWPLVSLMLWPLALCGEAPCTLVITCADGVD